MSYRTPQELVEAFRDWHVPVRAYEPDGRPWYSHTTSGGWNARGVLHHHTAGSGRLLTSDLSRRAMLRILRNGYSGLPGPLCHFAPAMDGNGRAVLWLVGWANVNHAGLGDPTNLAQLKAGNYRGRRPTQSTVDGNSSLYGLEYMHPGDATRWPDELLEVGHLAGAAINDAHGWEPVKGSRSHLDHREWTPRKIDRSWHGDVRQAVLELQQAGPAGSEGTMSWSDRLPRVGDARQADGSHKTMQARWMLGQTWNRAGAARTAAVSAERSAKAAHTEAAACRDELAQLRAELPELIEHAAAVGARKALADSVVTVDVNVTKAGAA